MLRLWRDRLLVWVAPAEVSWLRLAAGFRRHVSAKRTIAVDAAYGAESWQGTVAALRSEARAWSGDTLSVTVVLSNHFVRYIVVPPSAGVRGIDEARALARFHFAKIHGERCQAWDVRLSQEHADTAQVATAVDSGLLPALRDCFPKDAQPRLASVQPYLVSAYNCLRAHVPASGAWLILPEAGRTCIALIAGDGWVSIQNIKGNDDDPQAWGALLDRERWRVNGNRVPDTALVYRPWRAVAKLPSGDSWKWRTIDVDLPDVLGPNRSYAPALTAL